ncbi:MAG: D-aminoacyl-tRNA deacylase [Thermoplasmatota archaeon]
MRLIVSSTNDKASKNIMDNLLKYDWNEIDEYKGNPVYQRKNDIMVSVNKHHIYVDNVDKEIKSKFSIEIDHVVYISKHESKAGVHSLTVHPVGNFGEAKFGGKDNELVPPVPPHMSSALRTLWSEVDNKDLKKEYEVSFEVTHHGPFLETPTYYIEIGSDETCWTDEKAGKIIASTLINIEKNLIDDVPILVCIGGGHYATRFTDLARRKKVSIGHMVPRWAMKSLNEKNLKEAILQSKADYIYFDRENTSEKEREWISKWAQDIKVDSIKSSYFENL